MKTKNFKINEKVKYNSNTGKLKQGIIKGYKYFYNRFYGRVRLVKINNEYIFYSQIIRKVEDLGEK